MDTRQHLKEASALAKSQNYDDAIHVLITVIDNTRKNGGLSDANYTKIIPYFQKAGRYEEGVSFALNTLMKIAQEDRQKTFSHKVPEIAEAFYFLTQSKIYKSLSLISKREGLPAKAATFLKLSESKFEDYKKQLEIGQNLQLTKDFEEYKAIDCRPPGQWSEVMKRKFQKLIEENLAKQKKDKPSVKSFIQRLFKNH